MNRILKKLIIILLFIFATIIFGTITVHAVENETARYLMEAETLSDGKIAILFIKGGTSTSGVISGGTLYLGVYNPADNKWTEEPVGETAPVAKEATLAIQGNTAHVAYITSDDKIAYTYQTESGWADVQLIISSNANGDSVADTLSAPDLAVDSNGKIHLVYIDTDGAGDGDYHKPDGVYLTNQSGAFVKTVVANCTGWRDAGVDYDTLVAPIKIDYNNEGYNIAYKIHNYSTDGWGGRYNNYTIYLTGSSYDMDTNSSGKIYETCKEDTNNYTLISRDGKYMVLNGNTAMGETEKTFSILTADMVLDNSNIYYAGINGTSLLFYQNGTFIEDQTANTAILSNHTKFTTLVDGENQYIIYTGSDEEKSLVIGKYNGGSLSEYLVPNAPTVYTVSFNTDGGSTVVSQEINEGETATRPTTNPTKEGYTFVDWYSDAGLSTIYDFSTPITEETTIYAKWEIITPKLLQANTVSFKDNLRLNFLAELYGDDIEGAYVIFKYNHYGEDREVTVPINVDDKNGVYYRFRCELTASEMTVNVTAELYLKNSTEPISTFTRSIREYLIAGLNNSTNDIEKDLFRATLNYGGYTQKYFNYNGESYAYEGYMENVSNVNISSEINFVRPEGFINGIKYYGASVFFRNAPYVRYYFKLDDNADINDYTFKIGDTTITPTEKDGKYYIESEPTLAYELDKKQEVKVIKDNQDIMSFDYSIITWAKLVVDNSNNDDEKNMAKSLYVYYTAAKAFKESNS